MKMMKRHLLFVSMVLLTACNTVVNTTADVAVSTGVLSDQEAEAFKRANLSISRSFADISPEEEYYMGRSVSANIINRYQVKPHLKENQYLNLLGQSLVLHSNKPETFKGYRFMILENNDINAFAAPGGFIFLSKGMIRLCRNEDDLAAVLAHEIAHIEHSHALKSINTNRFTEAATTVTTEAAKTWGNTELAQLAQQFEGSISDMTQTLINSGYSRELEYQADETAILILQSAGYDSYGLIRVLDRMRQYSNRPDVHDFTSTHPSSEDRIAHLTPLLKQSIDFLPSMYKVERFWQVFRGF